MAIVEADDVAAVRAAWGRSAKVRTLPTSPITISVRLTPPRASPAMLQATYVGRQLAQQWQDASGVFRTAWSAAMPEWSGVRRADQMGEAHDWLAFATYHWCDRFYGIDSTLYEPGTYPRTTPGINVDSFRDDGHTWRFYWSSVPDLGYDPRSRMYIYQLDPKTTQRSFPTGFWDTRLVLTVDQWGLQSTQIPVDLTLAWPIKIGQRARLWGRIRSASSYAHAVWVEQKRQS